MSHRIGNRVFIRKEDDGTCEFCGAVAETRPYGPRRERICCACAKKDPVTTERMMGQVLFGIDTDEAAERQGE